MGQFGLVRRIPLADVVYEDRGASLIAISKQPKAPASWPERLLSQRSTRTNFAPEASRRDIARVLLGGKNMVNFVR